MNDYHMSELAKGHTSELRAEADRHRVAYFDKGADHESEPERTPSLRRRSLRSALPPLFRRAIR
jgi:hypothetical protein